MPENALLKRDVEALLFAAGDPVTPQALAEALAHHGDVAPIDVHEVLLQLAAEYPVDGHRGIELAQLAGGWVFRTHPASETALDALLAPAENTRLSPAALETLAVVAYAQPVSRPEIADVRGVNSDSVLQGLVERELVCEVGRRDGPGAAVLYGTTTRFEVAFGLESLGALPRLDSFAPGEDAREELRRKLGLNLPE